MSLSYTLVSNEGEQNVTLFVEGKKPLTAHSTHPRFEAIVAGILADDATVADLFDISTLAGQKFERLTERITVANGRVYFDNEEIDSALAEQIVTFVSDGVEDWKPLAAFFENVMQNPNEHSREQLYGWVKAQNISITETGLLVGYKGVERADDGSYVSSQSGTAIVNGEVVTGNIPNPIGGVVEMPRSEVMHNPRADCDAGLHVGSFSYAKGYAPVLLEVHLNPRDVVSVPDAGWKLRTCRYRVVRVVSEPVVKRVVTDATKTVQTPEGEYDLVVGDQFEDADKRRAGRILTVEAIEGDAAIVKSEETGVKRAVKLSRLFSRKYKIAKKKRRAKKASA